MDLCDIHNNDGGWDETTGGYQSNANELASVLTTLDKFATCVGGVFGIPKTSLAEVEAVAATYRLFVEGTVSLTSKQLVLVGAGSLDSCRWWEYVDT